MLAVGRPLRESDPSKAHSAPFSFAEELCQIRSARPRTRVEQHDSASWQTTTAIVATKLEGQLSGGGNMA